MALFVNKMYRVYKAYTCRTLAVCVRWFEVETIIRSGYCAHIYTGLGASEFEGAH